MQRRTVGIAAFLGLAGTAFALSLKLASPVAWDEGWYCLVARSWNAFGWASVKGLFSGSFGQAFTNFFEQTSGTLLMHTTAKPLFVAIQALALVASPRTIILALPSALAYAGTVFVIWNWASAWAERADFVFRRAFALSAAGLVAFSPFFLTFSATWYPHVIAAFFFTAAMFLLWRGARTTREAVLSGVLLAAAVLVHYSLAPVAVVIAVGHLWSQRSDRARLFAFVTGALAPFLFFILISIPLERFASVRLQPELIWSYPKEFLGQFVTNTSAGQKHPLYYLGRLAVVDGWPTVVMLFASLALLVGARRKKDAPWLALFWGSLAFISALATLAARTLVPFLPLGFLLAAAGLWTIVSRLESVRWRRYALVSVCAVIMLVRLPFLVDVMRFKNPFRVAAAAAVGSTDPIYASLRWPIYSCLLSRRVSTEDSLNVGAHGIFIDEALPLSAQTQTFLDAHARVITSVPVALLATRDLWNETTFGEPVAPSLTFQVWKW